MRIFARFTYQRAFLGLFRCNPCIVQIRSYAINLRTQFGDVVSTPACAAISEAASNVVFRFAPHTVESGLLASPRIIERRLRNVGAGVDNSVHVDNNILLFARPHAIQRGSQNVSVVLYVGDLGCRQKLKGSLRASRNKCKRRIARDSANSRGTADIRDRTDPRCPKK